jgi:hypothetical protein
VVPINQMEDKMRNIILGLVFATAMSAAPALAGGEGGGEGGGPGVIAAPPAAPAAARAPAGASGTSTLPGGATITLSGPAGNRDVEVTTGSGRTIEGKHIRTTHNRQTGITTVWVRNDDGSRTGYHVDRDGNEMVSNHKF